MLLLTSEQQGTVLTFIITKEVLAYHETLHRLDPTPKANSQSASRKAPSSSPEHRYVLFSVLTLEAGFLRRLLK